MHGGAYRLFVGRWRRVFRGRWRLRSGEPAANGDERGAGAVKEFAEGGLDLDNARSADSSDIRHDAGTPFLVTGFFTPDYFPLADGLGRNLAQHGISHHLYAREKRQGEWGRQTLRKPSILQAARRDHAGSALILMDVDCRLRGDISPMLDTVGDIAFPLGQKAAKSGRALMPGTRVLLVRPTPVADTFLALWNDKCRLDIQPVGTDEIRLQLAIEDSAGRFAFAVLPRKFVGIKLRKATPDDVIVHDSAVDKTRFLGGYGKQLQQRFRVLRNSAHRLATGREYK